jgi:hypothetical protein
MESRKSKRPASGNPGFSSGTPPAAWGAVMVAELEEKTHDNRNTSGRNTGCSKTKSNNEKKKRKSSKQLGERTVGQ